MLERTPGGRAAVVRLVVRIRSQPGSSARAGNGHGICCGEESRAWFRPIPGRECPWQLRKRPERPAPARSENRSATPIVGVLVAVRRGRTADRNRAVTHRGPRRALQADVLGWSSFMQAAGAARLATDTGKTGVRGNVSQHGRATQALTTGNRSGCGDSIGDPSKDALRVRDFRFLASPPQGRSRGADREGTV